MASRLSSPQLSPSPVPRRSFPVIHGPVARFSLRALPQPIQLPNRQVRPRTKSTGTGDRQIGLRRSVVPGARLPLTPRSSTLSNHSVEPPPLLRTTPNPGQAKGLQAVTTARIASSPPRNCSLLAGQVRMCPGIDIQALRSTLPQPKSSTVPSFSSPGPHLVWSTEKRIRVYFGLLSPRQNPPGLVKVPLLGPFPGPLLSLCRPRLLSFRLPAIISHTRTDDRFKPHPLSLRLPHCGRLPTT